MRNLKIIPTVRCADVFYPDNQTCSHTVRFQIHLNTRSELIISRFSDGLAAGLVLSLSNYLLLGWGYEVDGFYLKSFEIWLACAIVFPVAGNAGFILLEYRLGHRSMLNAAYETLRWVPFL